MSNLTPIRTPRIGVCSTGIGDAVCRGCKRFAHEVIDWNGYSRSKSGPLMLDRRASGKVCRQQTSYSGSGLLSWQMSVQKIRHQPHHDPYCHCLRCSRPAPSNITAPEQFGFEVLPVIVM